MVNEFIEFEHYKVDLAFIFLGPRSKIKTKKYR